MLKIYGTMLCEDCAAFAERLKESDIAYTFCEFEDSLDNLREFIRLRDSEPVFDAVKAEGGIGIPCILKEDGSCTLDWESCLKAQS
ncbi:hypothetical protein [Clostridium sp. AN503]|uniref:hypothetical protein n=1 Tax=Clostridium sp. AN503 TaxID=3160598 RepID=UPI003457D879